MQRIGDHARALELLGEIDREQDLRQLALAVGARRRCSRRVSMTSAKSIACWPAEATLTIRAGALALSSGSSRWVSRKPAR